MQQRPQPPDRRAPPPNGLIDPHCSAYASRWKIVGAGGYDAVSGPDRGAEAADPVTRPFPPRRSAGGDDEHARR
jgi:hypothetical protein